MSVCMATFLLNVSNGYYFHMVQKYIMFLNRCKKDDVGPLLSYPRTFFKTQQLEYISWVVFKGFIASKEQMQRCISVFLSPLAMGLGSLQSNASPSQCSEYLVNSF